MCITDSWQEGHAIAFFQRRTSPQLAGSYQNEPWCRLIIYLAHTDPAVRHAACALASANQAFEAGAGACVDLDDFGRQKYSSAIRQHVTILENSNDDVQSLVSYLASCILFICTELLQFHFKSAAELVRQGIRLLRILLASPSETTQWPLSIFERFLRRLRAQCVSFFGSEGFDELNASRSIEGGRLAELKRFNDVESAREHFEQYRAWYDNTHWRSAGSQNPSQSLLDVTRLYWKVNSHYGNALHHLQKSLGGDEVSDDHRAFALLKLRQLFLSVSQNIALACSSEDERQDAWDAQTMVFEEILDLCQIAMGLSRTQRSMAYPDGQASYSFTLDSGTVAPLADVAHLCRDPRIRRRAIELLRLQPRREGLADSLLMACISERIVQLEENDAPGNVSCASDIPPTARILRVVPSLDVLGQKAVISFYKYGATDSYHQEHVTFERDLRQSASLLARD